MPLAVPVTRSSNFCLGAEVLGGVHEAEGWTAALVEGVEQMAQETVVGVEQVEATLVVVAL